MHRRTSRATVIALILAVASFAVAACGSSSSSSSSGTSSSASTPAAAKKIKVGLVTDIGGLNDRSFNALANKGLQDAQKQLGIQGRVLISKSNADYVPNLSTLANQKYDMVIAVGFLMADATEKVAKKFPNVKFAIIDSSAAAMKSKPTNVEGLLFKEQEAGYLVGYLSGLYAKDNKVTTIGSIGGLKIPPVDHYIAGYQAGAKAADPSIKTLNGYSQDFVDQAKCKEIALDQISKGAKVVFQVAGQCGLGVLDAAKEKSVQGIGVDADQAYLGPQVFTSALKKVDVAVLTSIKGVQDGTYKGGQDVINSVQSGGIGYGKLNAAAQKYAAQVKAVQDKISSGSISNIPDTVKG
ncbi:MAG: basic rane protein [Solirubrobacteraceae bacterium]|nr:basic rane protein [Solirubrobacteraceae bacterium]MEA2356976.1 basic rane protein [Solirubrobacteraceae bacterium]MEA2392488.1 basic rane protein [Solirubrobacteraceae bacterium]